jgi:protein-S-isoprenylcysteine O-methyltransferase Ste14
MNMLVYRPGLAIAALWLAFALSWLLAMFWRARAAQRLGFVRELPYRAILVLGGVLFAIPAHGYTGRMRLWHVNLTEAWVCVGVIALGIAFAWWARIYLGPLWSGTITAKTDHRVIDTGPYAIVRHPIYTGLLLSILATMAAKGTALAILGAVLITIGLWMKARLEEGFLREQLGADAYDAYRRRVPMLVPFGPKST